MWKSIRRDNFYHLLKLILNHVHGDYYDHDLNVDVPLKYCFLFPVQRFELIVMESINLIN